MATPRLEVEIDVSPLGGDRVRITGTVRNRGDEVADPQVFSSEVLVDGVPLRAWTLAGGNGTIDVRLVELPPGDEVSFSREVSLPGLLGEEHRVVLRLPAAESPAATI